MKTFGDLLRYHRCRTIVDPKYQSTRCDGMSQIRLAELVGIHYQTINNYERRGSRFKPGMGTALKIANALGLTGQDRENFFTAASQTSSYTQRKTKEACPLDPPLKRIRDLFQVINPDDREAFVRHTNIFAGRLEERYGAP